MEDQYEQYRRDQVNYELMKQHLPEELIGPLERFSEICRYWYECFLPWTDALVAPLHKLALEHYPTLRDPAYPDMPDALADANRHYVGGLLPRCLGLLNECRAGTDPGEKYPKLEQWRGFYCNPSAPPVYTEADIPPLRRARLPPGEIAAQLARENEESRLWHQWEQARIQAFADVVQPLLFRYLPDLENLEGDYWVLYAVELRDCYDGWRSLCEALECKVSYGLPPDCLAPTDENDARLMQAIRDCDGEVSRAITDRRQERILAEARERWG